MFICQFLVVVIARRAGHYAKFWYKYSFIKIGTFYVLPYEYVSFTLQSLLFTKFYKYQK